MTAIWHNDGTGWALLPPVAFPDEDKLHSLVEQTPQLLPLAGSPSLVIVGREVQLGSGRADLVALEPSGRVVLIEIKLARNAETRRAVVAQVLTYAAYLYGMGSTGFDRDVLGHHLRERGHETLASVMASVDQEGAFDSQEFSAGLEESLSQGRFRLVIVLDAAPEELIRLVGYLEAVSDKLLIDLVTVASYNRRYAVVDLRIKKGIDSRLGGETLCLSHSGYTSWRCSILPTSQPVQPWLTPLTASPTIS